MVLIWKKKKKKKRESATKRDAMMLRARSTTTTTTTATTTTTSSSFSSKRIPPKPLLLDGKRRRQRKHQNIILATNNAHFSPSKLRSGRTPVQHPKVGVKVVAKKATTTTKSTFLTDALVPRRGASVPALRATRDDGDDVPFGYTRLDVILIGGGVTGLGFAAYYGLQEFAGFDAQWAGNVVQLTFVLLLTLLWVGSYVQRVFNKDMTYGKQLKEYEEAVMQKRLEEMPESELMALMDESEKKER